MNKKPKTMSITRPEHLPQQRQASGEQLVFAGVIAHCQLMLENGGALYDFELAPDTAPVVVGRITDNSTSAMGIDLSPFNAHEMGVSRAHAQFERSGVRLFLRDRGSTNGTWVNGNRLKADYVYEVFHGDRIEFGRMASKLYIKS